MSDYRSKDEPVFHYSRKDRLAKASKAVQNLYEDSWRPVGPVRRLIASKSSLFIILAILLFALTAFIIQLLSPKHSGLILNGNRLTIETVRYEDNYFIFIDKEALSSQAYVGEITLKLGNQVSVDQVFTAAPNERLQAVFKAINQTTELIIEAGSELISYQLTAE